MKHIITCPHCGETAATVTIAAAQIETSQTPGWLQDFLTARCAIETGARVRVADFRMAYEQWAATAGAPQISARTMGIEVSRLPGVRFTRDSTSRAYEGIRLS